MGGEFQGAPQPTSEKQMERLIDAVESVAKALEAANGVAIASSQTAHNVFEAMGLDLGGE